MSIGIAASTAGSTAPYAVAVCIGGFALNMLARRTHDPHHGYEGAALQCAGNLGGLLISEYNPASWAAAFNGCVAGFATARVSQAHYNRRTHHREYN